MAVDLEFAAAFIDHSDSEEWSSHVVFGKRLRKFCLWHRLLLSTIESPLLNGGSVSLFDIRTAVGICRLRFGNSTVRKPLIGPALMLLRAIGTSAITRRSKDPQGHNPLQRGLSRHTDAFLAYCGDYLQKPEYTVIPRPTAPGSAPRGRRGRAPEELELVAEIIQWSGWSERTVWEMPMGRINWYLMMARKLSGMDVDPIDDEEREFQKSAPEEFRRAS